MAREDNPTEEVIPTEEDKTDGTTDVGMGAVQVGDVDHIKAATTPTDM